MSAYGYLQTFRRVSRNVRFTPEADIRTVIFG